MRWRAEAPSRADFSVQAFRLITHGREDRGFPPAGKKVPASRRGLCGGFRESLEVHEAWMSTVRAAEALGTKIVVFETPASFLPGPDRLRDMYRFFRKIRSRWSFVWHPRGSWETSLADKVCADLGLIRAFDPLADRVPARGAFLYLRPSGPRSGGLSVDNLSTISSAAAGRPAYVVFSHRDSFPDALRLAPGPNIS